MIGRTFMAWPSSTRALIGAGLLILAQRPSAPSYKRPTTRATRAWCFVRAIFWLKVKPVETYDVAITRYVEGEGKHAGRLGLVTTEKGSVGAGFTDAEREILWTEAKEGRLLGQVREVSSMPCTSNGKFRHPVFVRMRPDKFAA